MPRSLVLFLTLLLLWAGTRLLNSALAGSHVAVYAGALFITHAALTLPLGEGLVATLLAGAVCDANTPVRFGTQLLLFAAAHVLVFAFRDRLPHDHRGGRLGIALGVNLGLFLALSLVQIRAGAGPRPWPRLGADLIASVMFVAVAATWFFALQERAIALLPPVPERLF